MALSHRKHFVLICQPTCVIPFLEIDGAYIPGSSGFVHIYIHVRGFMRWAESRNTLLEGNSHEQH